MKSTFVICRKGIRTVSLVLIALLLLLFSAILVACNSSSGSGQKIGILTDDFKTEYYVGDSFVAVGGLKTSAKAEPVPITQDMITGFDTSLSGTIIVKITFGDYVATAPITVKPLKAVSLSINEETLPTAVYQNAAFPSGVTMKAVLSNGKVEPSVAVTSSMIGGFKSSEIGEQRVTVAYLGSYASFTITVKQDTRRSITLVGAKETYSVGEQLYLGDAHLDVLYESGKVNPTALTANLVPDFTTELGGEHTVTVTYKGLTCDYTYFVEKQAENFRLLTSSLPTVYEKGDSLPATGKGTLSYNDGTSQTFLLTSENVPDFTTETAGEKTVDIIISGVRESYTYTVLPSILSATVYGVTPFVRQGSSFDGLGELVVVYESMDGVSENRENIPLFEKGAQKENISQSSGTLMQYVTTDRLRVEYCTSVVGDEVKQKIYFRTRVIEFAVLVYPKNESETTVESISIAGVFTPIIWGESINTEGVQVGINYKYLSSEIVDCQPSWVSVHWPENMEEDYMDVPVTIECFGVQEESSVRVLSEDYAERVTSIAVFGMPTLFFEGDELSLDGVTMLVTYGGNYRSEWMQPTVVEGFDTESGPGDDKIMTVMYQGCSVEIEYRVIAEEDKTLVTDISISGFDPLLFVGDTISMIDRESYEVTVTYGYGYSYGTIPLSDDAVILSGGPTFEEEGLQPLLLTCGEIERTIYVMVHPESDKERVTSIAIIPDTVPSVIGVEPDLSQVIITVTYGYGYKKGTVLLGESGASYDRDALNINGVGLSYTTATYAECSCGFFVNFISGDSGNVLQRLEIDSESKRTFVVGEEFDGVNLIARYKNKTERIPVTAKMASGFDSTAVGEHSITISYGGKGVIFSYTVIAASGQEG